MMMTLLRLLIRYSIDFVMANVTIARQVLSPKIDLEASVVTRKTRVRTPAEILALSNLIGFTPGSLVIELEPEDQVTLHLLATDAEAVADEIMENLEEPLLELTRKKP